MLTQQDEGLSGFHRSNRNQWGESWQVVGKNWEEMSILLFFGYFMAGFRHLMRFYCRAGLVRATQSL
jgi:hypothetical protein